MSVSSVARVPRPAPWLPPLTAALAALVGLVNIASNYTPGLPDRVRVLLQLEPVEAVPLAHALVLPIGVALLILAFYLARRRRGAFTLAVLVLTALGMLDLIKGLDIEEALLSFGVAGFLFMKRDA